MQNKYRFVVVVGSLVKSNGYSNGTNKQTKTTTKEEMIHVGMPLYVVCGEGDK